MGMVEHGRGDAHSAPGASDAKVLPIEELLGILRLILRVEPVDVLLQEIVDTICDSFGIRAATLGVLDERSGFFTPVVVRGYSQEQAAAIKKHAYTVDRMKTELSEDARIGPTCYYVRAENRTIVHDDDMDYVLMSEMLGWKRRTPSDWHELDYIDFVMTDRIGNWIGWIEVDCPANGKVPSKATLDRIQVLADLAGIAIENSKMYEEAVNAMMDSRGYLDLIVHDIGNMVDPLKYYVGHVSESAGLDPQERSQVRNALAIAVAMKSLVDNVRKLSEVKDSEPAFVELYDLKEVLAECIAATKREFPERGVIINMDTPETLSPVVADDLIHDLFTNILNNAVKYTPGKTAELEIRVRECHSACSVEIEDRGIGIPDEKKSVIFERFAPRPEGVAGAGLGLSIVSLLVKRYNGLISVRDRVPGDCSHGTCFEVSLPKSSARESDQRAAGGLRGPAVSSRLA